MDEFNGEINEIYNEMKLYYDSGESVYSYVFFDVLDGSTREIPNSDLITKHLDNIITMLNIHEDIEVKQSYKVCTTKQDIVNKDEPFVENFDEIELYLNKACLSVEKYIKNVIVRILELANEEKQTDDNTTNEHTSEDSITIDV